MKRHSALKQLFNRKHLLFIVFAWAASTITTNTYAQSSPTYSEANYSQSTRKLGIDNSDEQYTTWYQNTQDTSYTLKKVFSSESRTQLLSKMFFKDSLPNGPFFGYWNGVLIVQGQYKEGKMIGERLTYDNGKMIQRAYFTEGIRSGTWEEYNAKEKLIRTTTFDIKGNVVSDIRYEPTN